MTEYITKKEAVCRALAELGNDAMPVAIQGWVKDKLGVGMSVVYVSTIKGELLRKAAKEKPAAKKPTPTKPIPAPEPKVQPSAAKPAPAPANGKLIHLEDIQTLKGLVQRVGPETLRTLIGALAK
jgi:hypothetical protein